MSIESTSVSNPVVREKELGSKRNGWGETHGSATGSKDGQLGSFWDKAFAGAQKLFGIDTAVRNDLHNNEDSIVAEEERLADEERRFENRRLNSAPSIGNTSFSRIATSIRREGSNELPSMAPVDQSMSQQMERSINNDELNQRRIQKTRIEEDAGRNSIDELEEEKEAKRFREKNAELLMSTPLEIAKNTSNGKEIFGQTLGVQGVRNLDKSIGTISATSDLNMSTSLATNSSEGKASTVQSPLNNVEEVSEGAARRRYTDGLKPSEADSGNSKRNGEVGVGQNSRIGNGKLVENLRGISATRTKHEGTTKDADTLVIDVEKTKQSLGAALENARLGNSGKGSQAIASGSSQSNQSGLAAHTVESTLEKEGGVDHGTKNGEALKQSPAKAHSNSLAQQDSAKPNLVSANNLGHTSADGSHLKRAEIRSVGNVIRPSSPLSNVGGAGPSQNAPLASAAGTAQGNGVTPPSQLKSSVEKSLGKQEFATALKESVSNKSLGLNSKSEGPQGVQLAGNDVPVSSKSSFTAKAQPISYSSKSADETKEVYTALSKNIDRLIGSKSNTVSIRINFDQGGSMALRVSMDSGHVSTAMQTDLPGLESLIKSSWSEFASELNQKGVKLTPPQFVALDSENQKNEQFLNFDQKGGNAKGESSNDAKSNGGQRSSRSNRQLAESSNTDVPENTSTDDLNSEQELKTYA